MHSVHKWHSCWHIKSIQTANRVHIILLVAHHSHNHPTPTEDAHTLDTHWTFLHRPRHKQGHTETKEVSRVRSVNTVPSRQQGSLAGLCLKVEGPLPVLPHHLGHCSPALALLRSCRHQKGRQDICCHHIHMLKYLPYTVVSKTVKGLIFTEKCHF